VSRNDTLSGRERVRLALEHRTTDRIPIGMVCAGINPPARAAFEEHLKRDRGISVDAYLEPLVDIVEVAPAYVGPKLAPRTDLWGVRRKPVSYGSGSYDEIEHYPLAGVWSLRDLDSHPWPEPAWFDYGVLPDRIRQTRSVRDRAVMVTNGNVFETAWYMRGFEQMLMDTMADSELFHAIMERVTRFFVAYFERVLEAAPAEIDLVFTADDLGDQRGLLLPLHLWGELIAPYHRRLNRVIHDHRAKVIYHSDGAVMDAVGGLVDVGIDVLQALQFSAAGMDPAKLKGEFGDRLCFEGGVSVQTTLPFGSAEDVRCEVEERIRVLGSGGGYILGPSHWIQAGTPPANIVAMFDTARDFYPF
jgi:uroporphyrinogen decarboxylase